MLVDTINNTTIRFESVKELLIHLGFTNPVKQPPDLLNDMLVQTSCTSSQRYQLFTILIIF
jgi:hypothetical protein